jgi:hypothetical protein
MSAVAGYTSGAQNGLTAPGRSSMPVGLDFARFGRLSAIHKGQPDQSERFEIMIFQVRTVPKVLCGVLELPAASCQVPGPASGPAPSAPSAQAFPPHRPHRILLLRPGPALRGGQLRGRQRLARGAPQWGRGHTSDRAVADARQRPEAEGRSESAPMATARAVPSLPWAAAADIPGTAHAGSRLNAVPAHGPAQNNRASSGFRPDALDPASARLTRPGSRPGCTRFGLAAARGPGSTRMRPAVRVTRLEPVLASGSYGRAGSVPSRCHGSQV